MFWFVISNITVLPFPNSLSCVDNNLGFCSLAQLLLNLRQWQLIIPCSRHTIFLFLYSNLLLDHCWTPEKEKLAKQAVPVCSTIFQSLHGIKKERKKCVRGENYVFYNIIYRNHVFLFYTECFLTWSEQQQKAVEGTKKQQNSSLPTFLLQHGFSIPLLKDRSHLLPLMGVARSELFVYICVHLLNKCIK